LNKLFYPETSLKNQNIYSYHPNTPTNLIQGEFIMSKFFKKYFKGGITRIPKEAERKFFFYASMLFIVIYLLQRFLDNSWS
jgi:hypothetical protein